ncbi:PepSY domain-containing protein [Streptomyces thermoalcalitolerans]|uniref:PepSY domain-containing protein n=1 Tax=Streptomyces thermoalcalitolerans TaxID=65605 RepID=A0ABN1NV27_9ACTN
MRSAQRITPLRSLAAACALSGSALLLAACTNSDTTAPQAAVEAQTSPGSTSSPTASPSPSPSPSLSRDQAERKELLSQAKVTWDQAADTAVGEVSGGKLVALELGRGREPGRDRGEATASPGTPESSPSPGAPKWEARVAAADGTLHRIDIDAVNGELLRSETEADQDADEKREITDWLNRAKQTPKQAVTTATDKVKGTVTGLELEENDNQELVWSADVVNTDNWTKTTVDVDAASGEIVREQVDRD